MSLAHWVPWSAFLTSVAALISSCQPKPPPGYEPVRILAAFNLTGSDSELDAAAFNGAMVAMKEINSSSGVLGRNLELIAVDTASDRREAVTDVEHTLRTESGIVAGIGYSDSGFADEVGALFQRRRLPFVSPGATDPKLPGRVGNEMFLVAYGDDAQARAMAEFAWKELGKRRIAIWMDETHEYTVAVGTYFGEAFQSLGGHVETQTSEARTNHFSDWAASVKRASPPFDAIYAATMPSTATTFIDQVRDAGVALPLLSGDGWDEKPVIELSREKGLSEIYFTTHRFIGVKTAPMKAFVSKYEAAFGEPPSNAFAALGYDTVGLLADAIRRAGSTHPSAIRDALAATTDYEGIVGAISYSPQSRVPIKPVSVIRVDLGKESLVWTTTPQVQPQRANRR